MAQIIDLNGLPKFETRGDQSRLHQTWERWMRSFELFVMGKGITNAEQKQALLLHCAGQDVQDIFYTLPTGEGESVYDKTNDALKKNILRGK